MATSRHGKRAGQHNPAKPAGVSPHGASLHLRPHTIEIATKDWGRLETFYRDDSIELAYAYVDAGGFCSRHVHDHKSNDFLVISGAITIVVQVGTTFLHSHKKHRLTQSTPPLHVRAGTVHWFEADQGMTCVLLELYRATSGHKIDPLDIRRFMPGGRKAASA